MKHAGISIDLAALIQLRHYANQLNLNRLVKHRQLLTGLRQSLLRGRGMEFSEVRNYQPGDDIRHMDWRVTARTGKAHTKIFHEEKQLPVFIVVDYSPSMFFGTRVCYKSVMAAQIAAIFAWSALHSGDQVGGLVFSGEQYKMVLPRLHETGVLRFLNLLADQPAPFAEQARHSLNHILLHLRKILSINSQIILLSDFQHADENFFLNVNRLKAKHAILAIQIFDPLEAKAPKANLYQVSDGKNYYLFDTRSAALRKDFHKQFEQKQKYLTDNFIQLQIPFLTLSTQTDISDFFMYHMQNYHLQCRVSAEQDIKG